MDNHPIPQDVTGFQFRLIGNMTVKQFGYVAIGAVGAVIIYYIPLFILIKIVLIPLLILGGVALAFLPIEGRPIDIMLIHFLKALFSPTQFIYQKAGGHLLISTVHVESKVIAQAATAQASGQGKTPRASVQREAQRQQQLSAYLSSLHQTTQVADAKETQKLASLFASLTPQPAAPATTPPPTLPKAAGTGGQQQPTVPESNTASRIQEDTKKLAEEDALIKQVTDELTQAKAAEQTTQGAVGQNAHTKVLELEKKLTDILSAKQQVEAELSALKTDATPRTVTAPEPDILPATLATTTPMQPASPVEAKASPEPTADFPSLPDSPNILLGVVKDSSGNVLPHILVEVTDAEGNPVRAFKTNQLGQFMSATQLKDGDYTIAFEDPKNQYKFDPVKLSVTGEILPPITIAAHDLREELRKALFA